MHGRMVAISARLSRTSDATRSFYTEATPRKTIACLSLTTVDRLLEVGFDDATSRIEACGTNGLWGFVSALRAQAPARIDMASHRRERQPWQ